MQIQQTVKNDRTQKEPVHSTILLFDQSSDSPNLTGGQRADKKQLPFSQKSDSIIQSCLRP